ncbi:hypothetical protein RFI_24672 [Reticulomyxa filosa]|uniref:Uncharacterized protein n=1 Tax=Reticulomyxa filosa TaxID=46433 RepID=X6MFA8_RETFI|nr:hypothetical protein RFI_24672 [Reticulomyxa filosa]|eukprot:ETO12703.1 hypothetical protein RFI_24672 [Reticulomyxa filosa]
MDLDINMEKYCQMMENEVEDDFITGTMNKKVRYSELSVNQKYKNKKKKRKRRPSINRVYTGEQISFVDDLHSNQKVFETRQDKFQVL